MDNHTQHKSDAIAPPASDGIAPSDAAANAVTVAAETSTLQTRVVMRVVFSIIGVILLVLALLWTVKAIRGVLLLVILAIFFAYLIAPLVRMLEARVQLGWPPRPLPRPAAIGIVYLVLFGALFLGIYFLIPFMADQAAELRDNLPAYAVAARQKVQSVSESYKHWRVPRQIKDYIDQNAAGLGEKVSAYVSETVSEFFSALLSGLIHYLPWFFLIPILAFFFLKDANGFRIMLLRAMPQGDARWRWNELLRDINKTLAAYIRAQLIACLLIGVLCTLGFLLLGVPYSVLLGVVAAFLEFIPLIGPLIVSILAFAITGFAVSFKWAAIVLLFLLILRIVHDYVTYPRIIGQGIHLHPVAIILSVLCGAELAGITGVFLAIPAVAIGTVVYRHWIEHRGRGLVAEILSKEVEKNVQVAEQVAQKLEEKQPMPTT